MEGSVTPGDIRDNRPVCVSDLAPASPGGSPIDTSLFSGLLVRYTPAGGTEITQDISFYGIDSDHGPVDDLVVLAEPIPVFDIENMRWDEVDSLIVFRASNEDLHPEEDALDCDVTVYYVTGTQGELPYVGRTSFELTVPWDRYLVTMPYGIDDIRDGEGGDPDARDLLVYNVSIGGELVALEICDPVDD